MTTNKYTLHRRGFTLIEVLVASAMTALVALAILAGIIYNVRVRALAREHTQATRLLTQVMEEFRHRQYSDLINVVPGTLVLDDNGTPDYNTDDITATVTLTFYDYATGTVSTDLPLDTLLVIEAEARWQSPNTGKFHSTIMVTQHSRSVVET